MISVIIPTYNEERALPGTLACLSTFLQKIEIIVVDGGSTDGTRKIVETYKNIKYIESEKGRAIQMNAGAAIASGEWFLFLHADTLLPDGAFTAISSLHAHVAVGGFQHRFSGNSRMLRFVSALHNLRAKMTRSIYGDQAMFVRGEIFAQVGGFPNHEYLEDIYFCKTIKKIGKPVLLKISVVTDSRKFEKMGQTSSFMRVVVILFSVLFHQKVPEFGMQFFKDIR